MRRLLGWSAMVGGTLAGAAAALLLLGPALGFYPWSPAAPGARTTGSVDLPRVPTAAPQRRAAETGLSAAGTLGTLGPGVTVNFGAPTAGGPAPAGGTRQTVRTPTGALVAVPEAVAGPESAQPAPAAPTPAAPTPAAPTPVTTPAPVTVADTTPDTDDGAAPTTVVQRPTTNSFNASSSNGSEEEAEETASTDDRSSRRESAIAKAIEKRKARTGRGRSEEAPPAEPAPEAVPAAPVASGEEEDDDEGHGWASGRDRSDGDNDDQHHGRGHDHDGNDDRPGRGGKD